MLKTSGGAGAGFTYDGDGHRVQATLSGATTVYIGDYYEFIPGNDLLEDFEGDTSRWSTGGLWHVTTQKASSPTHSAWYGQESTGNYDTGGRTTGSLVVSLPGVITAKS